MRYLLCKYLVSAAMVVIVSEFARRLDRVGALIAALPLVTLLTLFWLYVEKQPPDKIANHAFYTFWYVLPTLPMFIAFPTLQTKFGFWGAILACILITTISFLLLALVGQRFGLLLF